MIRNAWALLCRVSLSDIDRGAYPLEIQYKKDGLYKIKIVHGRRKHFPFFCFLSHGQFFVYEARRLESSLDLFDCVSLDNVADLDVIVALDVQTAVHSHVHLLDIVLESLE